jgi:hypothetical protein
MSATAFFRADSIIFVVQRSEESEPTPMAMAVGVMQIGTQLVSLTVSNPFTGKASILTANDWLLTWSKAVYGSNARGKWISTVSPDREIEKLKHDSRGARRQPVFRSSATFVAQG